MNTTIKKITTKYTVDFIVPKAKVLNYFFVATKMNLFQICFSNYKMQTGP